MSPRPRSDFSDRSSAELVRLAKAGEVDAYGVLIQRCNQRLFRVARAIVRDDAEAEDVVQEAYVRAFAALPGFREEAQVLTWLTSIVLNEARGRLRRRRPTLELSSLDAPRAVGGSILLFPGAPGPQDPERGAATTEARRLLERAIDDLPPAFRLVFVLREIEGLSVEETAKHLALRPETVKTRLHRARRLLRQALDATLASAFRDAFPFLGARCERIRKSVLARLIAG